MIEFGFYMGRAEFTYHLPKQSKVAPVEIRDSALHLQAGIVVGVNTVSTTICVNFHGRFPK